MRVNSACGVRQSASGKHAHIFSTVDRDFAVHDDVLHAGGKNVGMLVGSAIGYGGWIESDHVGELALAKQAAVGQVHGLRGEAGGGMHGRWEREDFLLVDIDAQLAREG